MCHKFRKNKCCVWIVDPVLRFSWFYILEMIEVKVIFYKWISKLESGFYTLLVPVAKEHKSICTNISSHYTLYNDNSSGRFEVTGIRCSPGLNCQVLLWCSGQSGSYQVFRYKTRVHLLSPSCASEPPFVFVYEERNQVVFFVIKNKQNQWNTSSNSLHFKRWISKKPLKKINLQYCLAIQISLGWLHFIFLQPRNSSQVKQQSTP